MVDEASGAAAPGGGAAPGAPPRFDPFDRSWWSDPYPTYERLLAGDASGRAGVLPVWYVARHADCEAALRDARLSADDRRGVVYQSFVAAGLTRPQDELPRSMLRLDPPDHDRLRSLVAAAFTRRAVEELDELIASNVSRLLARFGGGPVDLVQALGYPLPVAVICELLGVPEGERSRLAALSRRVVGALDPEITVPPAVIASRRAAIDELRAVVAELLARCRRDGSGSRLVAGLLEPGAPDALGTEAGKHEAELVSLLVLLLIAGFETTANLIANAALLLARRHDLAARVAGDHAAVAALVEEVLRLDPPVQLTSRIATEDLAIGGLEVAAGHLLIVLIGAANRDPLVFDRPADVVLGRPARHLSFSMGVHHCLGAALARAEARAAIGALLEHWRCFELVAPPRYRETLVLRGLDALEVVPA